MPFSYIYVPTIDSLRYSFILETLLNLRENVYVTGETGTGKTAIIQNIIKKFNATEEWTFIRMNFSAQTSSKEIQSGLENKLEQERGKKFLWGHLSLEYVVWKGVFKCLFFSFHCCGNEGMTSLLAGDRKQTIFTNVISSSPMA